MWSPSVTKVQHTSLRGNKRACTYLLRGQLRPRKGVEAVAGVEARPTPHAVTQPVTQRLYILQQVGEHSGHNVAATVAR